MSLDAMWEFLSTLAPRSALAGSVPQRIASTVFLLLAGWLLARAARAGARRLVRRVEAMMPPDATATVPGAGGRGSDIVIGATAFWIVMVLAAMAATEVLGLPVISAWLSGVASYLPRILLAALVASAGLVVAGVAGRAAERLAAKAGVREVAGVGRLTQIAIITTSLLVAVEQLGIGYTFLTTAVSVALGVAFGSAGLAFALGARDIVAQIVSSHYVAKTFFVGQVIRHGETEGRIVRITATAVVVESSEGEFVIPAKLLIDGISLVVTRET